MNKQLLGNKSDGILVGKIVDEACATLGVDATPQYITALTELVYAQAGIFSYF